MRGAEAAASAEESTAAGPSSATMGLLCAQILTLPPGSSPRSSSHRRRDVFTRSGRDGHDHIGRPQPDATVRNTKGYERGAGRASAGARLINLHCRFARLERNERLRYVFHSGRLTSAVIQQGLVDGE